MLVGSGPHFGVRIMITILAVEAPANHGYQYLCGRGKGQRVEIVRYDAMQVEQVQDRRKVLFLQGLASPFFWRLGRYLTAAGADIHRINFCAGDLLFWPSLKATNYRGSQHDWPDFLNAYLTDHGITDIILFGDCRYYHQVASRLARRRGIAVHVFEEGYLRPDWITLERGAANANSSIPSDPDVIRALARLLPYPERPVKVGGSFANRAMWDVAWNATSIALWPLFPHYVRHRPRHPLLEGVGWLRRLARRRQNGSRATRTIDRLLRTKADFFVLPLQLDSDYQIRMHSDFAEMGEVVEKVLGSFATQAPVSSRLVVKVHPLDNGLVDRFAQVGAVADRLGIADRIDVIDGGHMPTLLRRAKGVVVVNSTAGLSALQYRRPTIALGRAIFKIEGLTFSGGLDEFWHGAPPPDRELFRSFRRVLLAQSQVNGSFFNLRGIDLAVENSAAKLGFVAQRADAAAFAGADQEVNTDLAA